jgi:hypothetical protein
VRTYRGSHAAIKECSEDRYDQMLGILPPTLWLEYGFLVREMHGHRTCTVTGQVLPTYAAFFHGFGRYYEGDPMTLPECRAFKSDDLPFPP